MKDHQITRSPDHPIYRGRLAPSPTGLLHLGHARTFWTAYERAREHGGVLVYRNEDLDPQRSKPEYARAAEEDLRWLGIEWQEGPFSQSDRRDLYLRAWRQLVDTGFVYPCTCSRKDLAGAAQAPHESNDEPMYPGTCRRKKLDAASPAGVNWRFRVPDGRVITFEDGEQGRQSYTAGQDFGDFVVWRRDDVPAYQLAVVVDDADMHITEVVRGLDLMKSTARQILIFEALGHAIPAFYHCDLVTDAAGTRLAKRTDALSIRALREKGWTPQEVRERTGL